jgi:membrane fusion protein, multidrug efflux system
VVTMRYVDPGALVPAATGGTQSALPVVDLADTDTLRVFIHVGQDVAPFVRVGDAVTIWQDEMPTKRIPAAVTYAAGALDPRNRTMQVEIDLDNRSWAMLPGTFAHVELKLASPPSPLLPDEAIVIRDGKTMTCVVKDGHAHYVPVDLGYNDGRQVAVLGGLVGGETVGVDVPVEVEEGETVQPVPRPAQKAP